MIFSIKSDRRNFEIIHIVSLAVIAAVLLTACGKKTDIAVSGAGEIFGEIMSVQLYLSADGYLEENELNEYPARLIERAKDFNGQELEGARSYLSECGDIYGAVVSLGDDVLTYGKKDNVSPWYVGVNDPSRDGEYLGVLSLYGTNFIYTVKGNEEDYLKSVTLVLEEGADKEELGGSSLLLGIDEGVKLLNERGVAAVFIAEDGKYVMTEKMSQIFSSLAPLQNGGMGD